MPWRHEFDPPILNPSRIGQIREVYVSALDALESGEDPGPLLQLLSELTEKSVTTQSLLASAGSLSPDVAAELLSRPEPPRLPSITREELVSLVSRLLRPDTTEAEEDWWIRVLQRNVAHPRVVNMLYAGERSADEIVDEALSYRSIIMGAGDGPGSAT